MNAALLNTVETALKALMPDETITVKDGIISACHGAVSIEEATCVGKRIGGTYEYPGWAICVWHEIPATRDEPADVSYEETYMSNNVNNVAARFVQKVFEMKSNQYWQTVSDQQWAQSCGEIW